MIYMQLKEYEKLLAHAVKCLPEEACGLVGGRKDEEGNSYIEKVFPLENTDHSEERTIQAPFDYELPACDMKKI